MGVSRNALVQNIPYISDGLVCRLDHFLFFMLSLIWGSTQKFVFLLCLRRTFTFLIWMNVTKVSRISTKFPAYLYVFTDKNVLELKAQHQWWWVFRSDFCSETLRSKTLTESACTKPQAATEMNVQWRVLERGFEIMEWLGGIDCEWKL